MTRLLLCAALLIVAAGQEKTTTNATCPLTGKKANPKVTSTYTKNVGFCCGRCKSKFEKEPDKFLEYIVPIKAKPVNAACPVNKGHAVSRGHTVAYNGMIVGFCCEDCPPEFTQNPTAFAKNIKNAGTPFNEKCPLSGRAVNAEKVTIYAKTVAFCCGNCKKKFDAEPDKFIEKVK